MIIFIIFIFLMVAALLIILVNLSLFVVNLNDKINGALKDIIDILQIMADSSPVSVTKEKKTWDEQYMEDELLRAEKIRKDRGGDSLIDLEGPFSDYSAPPAVNPKSNLIIRDVENNDATQIQEV